MAIRIIENGSARSRWVWVVAGTPVLLSVHWALHHLPAPASFIAAFTLLGIIPALLAAPVGFDIGQLGIGLGNARRGIVLTLIGVPVAVAAGWVGAGDDAIAAAYPLDPAVTRAALVFSAHAALYFLYYIGFDFFFRGFLLLGLATRFGPAASNLFQASLATLVHVGKPPAELIAAFPASLAFGWVTLRTGSIWYAIVLHWVVGVTMDWFLLG